MPFASPTTVLTPLRYMTLHVAFAFLISKLFDAVGIMEFPVEASSVSFWALIIIIALIYAKIIHEIVPSFDLPPIAHLFRLIPRHQGFDYLIQELTNIVQKHYTYSLLFEQSPVRLCALIACKCIYKFTRDAISGSLASVILISFLVHSDLVLLVFIIWATFLFLFVAVSYLNNNAATQS